MEHQHTNDDYEDLAKEKLEDGGLLKAQARRLPDVRFGAMLGLLKSNGDAHFHTLTTHPTH